MGLNYPKWNIKVKNQTIMDAIPKVMKLRQLFQYALACALMVLSVPLWGQAFQTRYDNGGKPINGDFQLIGGASGQSASLSIQTAGPCPAKVKKALLYWGGHEGAGNPNSVRMTLPNGTQKVINKQGGQSENEPVRWEAADWLIYRVYFDASDGVDMDMSAILTSPSLPGNLSQGGFCSQGMPNLRNGGFNEADQYIMWSGDNTNMGGLESILINIKKIKQDFPASGGKVTLRFRAGWYGSRWVGKGNLAIKAEAYRGNNMLKDVFNYNWLPGLGTTKIGEAIFPKVTARYPKPDGSYTYEQSGPYGPKRACSDMVDFGSFEYDPADGRVIWIHTDGTREPLGSTDNAVDARKLIVNERQTPPVNDDSYYYNYADVTADLQALESNNNANLNNGSFKVENIYNNPGGRPEWYLKSGWALVVVYEDPNIHRYATRVIKIEDGFERVGAGGSNRTRTISGFKKPAGAQGENYGQVTLGGESSQRGDSFQVNLQTFAYYGRTSDNFFNGTVTSPTAVVHNSPGWDVSFIRNDDATAVGANSITMKYLYDNGGNDAYFNIVNVVSAETERPVYQLNTEIYNSAGTASLDGQRVAKGTAAKYRIRAVNSGSGIPTGPIIYELDLPKNLTYDGVEDLPAGASMVAGYPQLVGDKTRIRISLPANTYPVGGNKRIFYVKVKTTEDCSALRDACSNKLETQGKFIYSVANPTEANLEQLSYKDDSTDCWPGTTTFFIDDAPCAQEANNTQPYCSALQLDGGEGFTYEWRRAGETTVISRDRRLNIDNAGKYVLTRTRIGGQPNCNNITTITYNITRRTGGDAEHPLRNDSHVTQKAVCNQDGSDYLQIAVCDPTITLTTQGISIADAKVKWYKYVGTGATSEDTCPPGENNITTSANWQSLNTTGKTITFNRSWITGDATHFAIFVEYDGCPRTYYFRAYKSELNAYQLDKQNILPCTAGAQGALLISGLPNTNYEYKVTGSSNAVGWTAVPNTGFSHTVTVAGRYTVTVRPKLAGGSAAFQDNVCKFEKTIDVAAVPSDATLFNLTKEDIKCYGASTGKLRIQLNTAVTLNATDYVTVTVNKVGGSQVATYIVDNDSKRDSNNAGVAQLSQLPAGKYKVTLTPRYGTGCTVTSAEIEITQRPQLAWGTVAQESLTCGRDKSITVGYTGGTPPYNLKITATGFTTASHNLGNATTSNIVITDGGFTSGNKTYNLELTDANGCKITKQVTYALPPKPVFTTTKEDADCSTTSGSITINVTTPANLTGQGYDEVGYQISKEVNGAWQGWQNQSGINNKTFANLSEGQYKVRVYYRKGTKTCYYPQETYTYTDPATGLLTTPSGVDFQDVIVNIAAGNGPIKAFAGVIQLACTTPTNSAAIRIANVSGGRSTTYEYRIDGGAWVPGGTPTGHDFANVAPGNHTVEVRNAGVPAGTTPCTWSKVVNVKQPLTPPTLTATTVYDCDGIARVNMTTNKAGYSYYTSNATTLPTTAPNTGYTATNVPSATFPAGTTGNKTVRVFYRETTPPDPNILIKEDFGTGKQGCATEGIPPGWNCGRTGGAIGHDGYTITPYTSFREWGAWRYPYDHTTYMETGAYNPSSEGRYIAFNGDANGDRLFYVKSVRNIEPNQPIKYRMFLYNLCDGLCQVDPNVSIRLVKTDGTVISRQDSGRIPYNRSNTDWREFSGELDPGNNTELRIEFYLLAIGGGGNDPAIDDIYVYQEPKACLTDYVDVNVNISDDKKFRFKRDGSGNPELRTVAQTCAGVNDGKVSTVIENFGTGSYQWKITNGAGTNVQPSSGWNTSTSANLQATGLAPGTYNLVIKSQHQQRYSNDTACEVTAPFTIDSRPVLTVTQNIQQTYLNCGEGQREVVLFDPANPTATTSVFQITGGFATTPQTYVITIKSNLPSSTEERIPLVNNKYSYIVGNAVYTIKITDQNNCNLQTKTYTVTPRVRIQTPTVAMTGCGTTKQMTVTAQYADGTTNANGVALKYRYRPVGTTTWTDNTPATSNVFNITSWAVGNYEVSVYDDYSCAAQTEVAINTPITSATTTVTHHTQCNGTVTNGSITVTSVTGAPSTATYEYAYKKRTAPAVPTTTPADADYTASNTFSVPTPPTGVTSETWDVWIRDTNANPVTCGVLATNVVVKGPKASSIANNSTNIIVQSSECTGSTGKLKIVSIVGQGPYKIELTEGSNPAQVSHINQTGDVSNYEIPNLTPGNYSLKIFDEGNGSCQLFNGSTYNFTITDMNITGSVEPQTATCGATTMSFIVKGSSTILPSADYEVLYRIVSVDGVPTGSTFVLGDTPAPTAGATTQRTFTGQNIGKRYIVAVAVRKRGTTTILCAKELPEFTLSDARGVDLTPADAGGTPNCNTFDLKVEYTAGNYDQVEFFLNNDGAPAEAASPVLGPFVASGAKPTYTFSGLQKGRSYTVYVHYKVTGNPTICRANNSVDYTSSGSTAARPNLTTSNIVSNTCSLPGTPGPLRIKFRIDSGVPSFTWHVYEVNPNGSMGTSVATGTATAVGEVSVPAFTATIPANGKRYAISVTDGNACTSYSQNFMVRATATPLQATGTNFTATNNVAVSCENTNGSITLGNIATELSGGVGPFTYRIRKTANAFLRRDIVVRTSSLTEVPVFNFRATDLDDTQFPSPGITAVTIEVTDEGTGCEVSLPVAGGSISNLIDTRYEAKYTIALPNTSNCGTVNANGEVEYDLDLTLVNYTGNSGTILATNYEVSIDGGATYTAVTGTPMTLKVPENFDYTKLKVRNATTKCDATNTTTGLPAAPNTRITYPKLQASISKIANSDFECIGAGQYRGYIRIEVTRGSTGFANSPLGATPNYQYQILEGGTPVAGASGNITTPHIVGGTTTKYYVEAPVILTTAPTVDKTYTVTVKDGGIAALAAPLNYCAGDQAISGSVTLKKTEDDAAYTARHGWIGTTDALGCTPGSQTGTITFFRNITSGREGTYTYKLLRYANASGGAPVEEYDVDVSNIVAENPVNPNRLAYKATVKPGWYSIKVMQSPSNTSSAGTPTCEIELTLARVEVKDTDPFQGNLTGGAIACYLDAGCAGATCGTLTQSEQVAKLRLHATGGILPYTFTLKEAGSGVVIETRTVNAASAQDFELALRPAAYQVLWEITDARGCTIDYNTPFGSPATTSGIIVVKPLVKVTAVTAERVTQMNCNPASNEVVKLTLTRATGNTLGYDVKVKQVSPVVGTTTTQSLTLVAGSGIQGTITLPHVASDVSEYEFIIVDKDTGCEFAVPDTYRVTKTPKPTVNLEVTEGACNNGSGFYDLTFKIHVEDGDYASGYNYEIKNVTTGVNITPAAQPDSAATVEYRATGIPAPTVPNTFTYEVTLTVTGTGCTATAQATVGIPQPIVFTDALASPMTYCDGDSNDDAAIAITSAITGGWGGPYQTRLVRNSVRNEDWSQQTRYERLTPGTYFIEVKDNKGCIKAGTSYTFLSYNSTSLPIVAGTVTTLNPTCTGEADGEIVLTGVTGGAQPATNPVYSYELFDAETQTSLGIIKGDDTGHTGKVTFTGIGAGKYFIRIGSSILCAEDSVDTNPIVINDPGSIVANATLSTYPGCVGGGQITVEMEGRPYMRNTRANYTLKLYDITSGAPGSQLGTTQTATGTSAHTVLFTGIPRPTAQTKYRVEIMDNGGTAGCEAVTNTLILEPVENLKVEFATTGLTTHLACYGSTYGKLIANATGGKNDEPYSYTLNLVSGGPLPSGYVTTNATGIFDGLPAGVYSVTVSQATGGCTPATTSNPATKTITEEPKYTATYEITQVKCQGEANGVFEVKDIRTSQKLDGSPRRFTYAITPRLDQFLDNGGKFENLAPGKYYVIMQDENGCRPDVLTPGTTTSEGDIFEFTITEPQKLAVAILTDETVHESCYGASDGVVKVRINGGTIYDNGTPAVNTDDYYEYKIDGVTTAWTRYDRATGITGLAAGTYVVQVRDANECTAETAQVTIEPGSQVQPVKTEVGYQCVDGVLKYIVDMSVTPASEQLNVTYQLDGVAHDNTHFELEVDRATSGAVAKNYVISMLHKVPGHGVCKRDVPITVQPQTQVAIDLDNVEKVKCQGGNTGAFTLRASGGSGRYQFGIKQADGTYRWQAETRFAGLEVGSYTAAVRDMDHNCIAERTNIQVEEETKIQIDQQSLKHVGCKGNNDGAITYGLSGGKGPYSWQIITEAGRLYGVTFKKDQEQTSSEGGTVVERYNDDINRYIKYITASGSGVHSGGTISFKRFTAGKYTIIVTDSNNCEQRKHFEIIEGVDLTGSVEQLYYCNTNVNENNTVLTVGASDTSAAVTYDLYVSVTTPYLVLDPSLTANSVANRLRYGFTGTATADRHQFEGTKQGTDNTHNLYRISHTTLNGQLSSITPIREDATNGTKTYKMWVYYYANDNPALSEQPLCTAEREFTIEYHDPITITNQSIANDLNLIKVKVTGGKQKYTLYFGSAQYHTQDEIKANYVQREPDVQDGDEVTYYVQKTDYEEENPATGNIEKKVRIYVEDAKGCGHSVFIYKEFEDVVIPNFFSPNGDGQYDTWAPMNLASYPHAETRIYDRYGRHIATLNNRQEWDGTYGGEALPTGDYWYILQLNEPDDNRTFKGHFTLYR